MRDQHRRSEEDDGNSVLRERARNALAGWRSYTLPIARTGIKAREIHPKIDPRKLATLIISSLEGAVMVYRLEKSEDALRAVRGHLDNYLKPKCDLPPDDRCECSLPPLGAFAAQGHACRGGLRNQAALFVCDFALQVDHHAAASYHFALALLAGKPAIQDEIGKAVLFLASHDSNYFTGIKLFVDGGSAKCNRA